MLNKKTVSGTHKFLFDLASKRYDHVANIRNRILAFLNKYDLSAKEYVSMYRGLTDFKQENLFKNYTVDEAIYEYLDSIAQLFELELKQQYLEHTTKAK